MENMPSGWFFVLMTLVNLQVVVQATLVFRISRLYRRLH